MFFLSLYLPHQETGVCHLGTLEHFEKIKMAAKMSATEVILALGLVFFKSTIPKPLGCHLYKKCNVENYIISIFCTYDVKITSK